MSVEPHDETTHARPKPSDKRRGLLAGRFRPGPLIEYDVFRTSHEALDEADGSKVVVHFLSERFAADREMRRATVARLLARVGQGNQFVAPLVEAGIENDRVFIVEPRSSGVTLRSVLRARARTQKPLTAAELLPVVARIKTALEAMPDDFVLGRISPRTVFIDTEGLKLAECFILPSLDRKALVAALAEEESLRQTYAPECMRGIVTRAVDHFAVGALVHEALTFQAQPSTDTGLGPLTSEVHELLVATPESRPGLESLLDKLASLAGLRLPELEAQPFELPAATRAARLAAFDEATDVELLDDDEDEDDMPIREEDKTRQIAMPNAGPVIDDLAMSAGERKLGAPAIEIEAAPANVPRAAAPKAPPPARAARSTRRSGSGDAALPAPKSTPPPASTQAAAPEEAEADEVTDDDLEAVEPDEPKQSSLPPPAPKAPRKATAEMHAPSVEVYITPVPPQADKQPRLDATDRIRNKRPGETTLQMRAISDDSQARPLPASRSAKRNGNRLVLGAMILAGVLLAAMLAAAVVKKRDQEAIRREMIERRIREITEE